MNYFALVADIKHSRKHEDRSALQEALVSSIREINEAFSSHISAELMINAGDSFQGIFLASAPILAICDKIRFSLIGLCEIRFGLGLGEIHTKIDYKQSILADGPAFWSAREAMGAIDNLDYYGTHFIHICIADPSLRWLQTLVNQILVGQDLLVAGWKNKQIELARWYIRQHGYAEVPQTQLAKEMQISVQQVNSTIKAMGFFAYLDMKKYTEKTLKEIVGGIT
ncbi:SatD family protein [Pleomorphochaeta sp. DL1XJH-081]|uniref:SatD family protein n=1 Tax=Pleomorphochaeta sp. DL1XJH-081 TaxID=3409690 RepID=UPI003BB725A6